MKKLIVTLIILFFALNVSILLSADKKEAKSIEKPKVEKQITKNENIEALMVIDEQMRQLCSKPLKEVFSISENELDKLDGKIKAFVEKYDSQLSALASKGREIYNKLSDKEKEQYKKQALEIAEKKDKEVMQTFASFGKIIQNKKNANAGKALMSFIEKASKWSIVPKGECPKCKAKTVK